MQTKSVVQLTRCKLNQWCSWQDVNQIDGAADKMQTKGVWKLCEKGATQASQGITINFVNSNYVHLV